MAGSYRSAGVVSAMQDSSDDGEVNSSDSDNDDTGAFRMEKRARLNPTANHQVNSTRPQNILQTASNFAKTKRSKNANIWGSVLTEQSSLDISTNLGAVGMQHLISRGPESFDLPVNFGSNRRDIVRYSDSNDSSNEETEAYQTPQSKTTMKSKNGATAIEKQRKRKVPKNKKNVPNFKPGQQVNLNKRCELSDTDPVDKVAEEIAFRLWERKKDLIRSLTETLGVRTTIDFCTKTEDIEKNGGLLTIKGVRRRTPGGTFMYLIRNDPKLDQTPINSIFSLEAERERMQWEHRKISKKTKPPELTEQDRNLPKVEEMNQPNTMEYNDIGNENGSSVASDTIVENIEKVGDQDGAGKLYTKSKQTAELSDGEIMDSDDDIQNAESFG